MTRSLSTLLVIYNSCQRASVEPVIALFLWEMNIIETILWQWIERMRSSLGSFYTGAGVDMYIIIKINKIIKEVSNCTTFLTVLQEKYTMKHHWVCDFCVIIGHKIGWTVKTLPQNHAICCANAILLAQFWSSVWCQIIQLHRNYPFHL